VFGETSVVLRKHVAQEGLAHLPGHSQNILLSVHSSPSPPHTHQFHKTHRPHHIILLHSPPVTGPQSYHLPQNLPAQARAAHSPPHLPSVAHSRHIITSHITAWSYTQATSIGLRLIHIITSCHATVIITHWLGHIACLSTYIIAISLSKASSA